MQLRLAEAAKLGSGPAVDAMKLLGISLSDVATLSADERFLLIRDRLSDVTDESERLFLAEELLGSSTERLTETIALSTEEFEAQTKAAAESGRVFSEDQVQGAEAARLAFEDAKDAIGGVVGSLTIALLPAVTALTGFITDSMVPAIEGVIGWLQEHDEVAKVLGDNGRRRRRRRSSGRRSP